MTTAGLGASTLVTIGGCAALWTSPSPTRTCDKPGLWQQLGTVVPGYFTVSGGTYSFTATGFDHSGFDPIATNITRVHLGPADLPPVPDPTDGLGGFTVGNARYSFYVEEFREESSIIDLPAGRYWRAGKGYGTIWIRPCSGGTITEVTPAPPPYTLLDKGPSPRVSEGPASTSRSSSTSRKT